MEPFRPAVDRVVASAPGQPLDSEAKRSLIGAVTARYIVEGEQRTLFDILTRVAQSLARAVMAESDVLWLPAWSPLPAGSERKPAARERVPFAPGAKSGSG